MYIIIGMLRFSKGNIRVHCKMALTLPSLPLGIQGSNEKLSVKERNRLPGDTLLADIFKSS